MLLILFSIFLLILIPVYLKTYGWQNFLWFSDIGLFLTFFGLLFKSPLLISMAGVGVLPFEIIWVINFFGQLFSGHAFFGLTNYMFNKKLSLFVRVLSFFHLVIPFLWFFLLSEWGYDHKAFLYQTFLIWIVVLATYFFTDANKNINWVFLPQVNHWKTIPSFLWIIILMICFPFLLLPFHLLLKLYF